MGLRERFYFLRYVSLHRGRWRDVIFGMVDSRTKFSVVTEVMTG